MDQLGTSELSWDPWHRNKGATGQAPEEQTFHAASYRGERTWQSDLNQASSYCRALTLHSEARFRDLAHRIGLAIRVTIVSIP